MTDREKICREFCEACGRIWIEWDEKCGGSYTYIDGKKCSYLHPDEVLREVMKWKDKYDFLWEIGLQTQDMYQEWVVEISYVLEPDKLLIAAHKWVVERK